MHWYTLQLKSSYSCYICHLKLILVLMSWNKDFWTPFSRVFWCILNVKEEVGIWPDSKFLQAKEGNNCLLLRRVFLSNTYWRDFVTEDNLYFLSAVSCTAFLCGCACLTNLSFTTFLQSCDCANFSNKLMQVFHCSPCIMFLICHHRWFPLL